MTSSAPPRFKPNSPAPYHAITTLQNPAAKLAAHIHPLVLLGGYYALFPSLVADPVAALAKAAVPLAVVQVGYCVVCLPVAKTGGAAQSSSSSSGKPGKPPIPKRKAGGKDSALSGRITHALLSLLLSSLLPPPLLSIILILLGAPLTTHTPHTLLLALHISLLAILPLTYVYGVDGKKWRDVVALMVPVDETSAGLLGVGVGAWLGAVPIPLDWDREWQKYPVTILTGAVLGFVAGKVVGGLPGVRGRWIDF